MKAPKADNLAHPFRIETLKIERLTAWQTDIYRDWKTDGPF